MSFHLSRASIKNIFGFDSIEVKFNDGANYLYGKNGAGKSSLTISGLWACIKGIAEQGDKFISSRFRCIGPKKTTGDLEYEFSDGENGNRFKVCNHVSKDANKITFQALEGSPLADDFLDDFFNVSLLSARNFCRLSGVEQAKALGIDTSAFDANIAKYKEERKIENRLIKEAGIIEPVEEVKPVNIEMLREKKKAIADKLNGIYIENCKHNNELRKKYTADVAAENEAERVFETEQVRCRDNILNAAEALSKLVSIGYTGNEVKEWIDHLPQPTNYVEKIIPEPVYIIEVPDDAEIKAVDAEIEAAYETNEQAKKYADYLIRSEALKARQDKVDKINADIEAEETARTNYITGKKFPFSDLTTDETGCLLFKNRPITDTYFSRGELEMIVAKLAASQSPLFKTRFIDEFGILDPDNQKKLVDDLVQAGFQVIVSIPGEKVEHDNAIVLRECKLVDTTETDERPTLL